MLKTSYSTLKSRRPTLLLYLILLLIGACTQNTPTSTPAPEPTAITLASPQPSATTVPTLTPVFTPSLVSPSFTPSLVAPSLTPTLIPIPTFEPTLPPTSTPTPGPPVIIPLDTDMPSPTQAVQPGNATQVTELARLGSGSVVRVVYSPDSRRIAAETSLGVYFYEAETYQQIDFLPVSAQFVGMAISPDWQTIAWATASSNLTYRVELRHLADGQLFQTLETEASSGLKMEFWAGGSQLRIGREIWQIADGTRQNDLPLPPIRESFYFSDFSPDEQTMALLTEEHLYLVRLSDNTILQETRIDNATCAVNGPVSKFTFSPDGSRLAAGGWIGCVSVWRTDSLSLEYQLGDRVPTQRSGMGVLASPRQHTGPGQGELTGLAFAPDGQTLAAADGYGIVRFWNLQDGSLTQTMSTFGYPSLTYAPDGSSLAVLGGMLQIWQPSTGTLIAALENHFSPSPQIALSPDGTQLLSFSEESVQQWFLNQGQRRRLSGLHQTGLSVAFSPNGTLFVTGSSSGGSGGSVFLWDATTGLPLRFIGRHESPWGVSDVSFTPDGQQIVSASNDAGIKWWSLDGELLRLFGDMLSEVFAIWPGQDIVAYDVCCEPSGIGMVHLGEVEPFQILIPEDGQKSVQSLAFSPDGTVLAVGDKWNELIWLYDTTQGTVSQTLGTDNGDESTAGVRSLTFSPDGQILAAAYDTGVIRLWRTSDGILLHTLTLSKASANSLVFSPDGTLLYGSLTDGTIRLWGIP